MALSGIGSAGRMSGGGVLRLLFVVGLRLDNQPRAVLWHPSPEQDKIRQPRGADHQENQSVG